MDHYCFVCSKRIEGPRHEHAVPNNGGKWVFVFHPDCRSVFHRSIEKRFHDVALRALGHPRTVPDRKGDRPSSQTFPPSLTGSNVTVITTANPGTLDSTFEDCLGLAGR